LRATRYGNEQKTEKQSDMSNSSHRNLLSKLLSPILTTTFTCFGVLLLAGLDVWRALSVSN
jgi:hypothetical protein